MKLNLQSRHANLRPAARMWPV